MIRSRKHKTMADIRAARIEAMIEAIIEELSRDTQDELDRSIPGLLDPEEESHDVL